MSRRIEDVFFAHGIALRVALTVFEHRQSENTLDSTNVKGKL